MAKKDDLAPKVDRLSLLPAELRSRIYSFVFSSAGEPLHSFHSIWPRRVHEAEETNNPWVRDTERLLDTLGRVRLKALLRLEFRWQHDCERFEREWMDRQGCICLGPSGHITEQTSP